ASVCSPTSSYRRAGRLRPPALAPQLKRDPLGSRVLTVSRPLSLAILITGAALYAAFIVWTVRRLWRPVVDPYSRTVYWFGVRLGGVIFWLVLSIGGSLSSEST